MKIDKKLNIYGFIPVRSGSTRVKNKNFLILQNGKSLLDINLDLCNQLKIFNKVFISSNKRINFKNKNFELDERSKELSNNKTTLIRVIQKRRFVFIPIRDNT